MAAEAASSAAASTPEATAAAAATRDAVQASETGAAAGRAEPLAPGEGQHYLVGSGVLRAAVVPYRRQPGDPLYRRLRIYTVDPALQRLEGAVATVNVAFEPLAAGPVGQLFEVDPRDAAQGMSYRVADLDERDVLLADGYTPSPSDPRFHQQMVYAVCSNVYSAFRTALGRNISWGFGDVRQPARLVLRPHYGNEQNAYFSNHGSHGELRFGYFRAPQVPLGIRTMPGGFVFTCLSHDIVAHEVTHALLDGLRPHFALPTNADVTAFHEGFADLMAIFQHFSYTEVVLTAIRRCRGKLQDADLLTQLALQFGHTTGQKGPLRVAIERPGQAPRQYSAELPAHELGSILVSAVFDAFAQIYQRKTERYLRLATQGSGLLPPGELAHDLQTVLAERASKLASQFLGICIRAIDYCPPVGLTFGDYLRALITADFDLVPDDRLDYRGALIDAFWRRNIYPRSATNLSEDALLWRAPRMTLEPVPALDFAALRFDGDPAHAAGPAELRRQACALGHYLTRAEHPRHLDEFGMVRKGDPRLDGDDVSLPCVQSIRSARRAGPQGQVVFDLVAEVTQQRFVASSAAGPALRYHGGATVILAPDGAVRLAIVKSVVGAQRLQRRRAFFASRCGQRHWAVNDGGYVLRGPVFKLLHDPPLAG